MLTFFTVLVFLCISMFNELYYYLGWILHTSQFCQLLINCNVDILIDMKTFHLISFDEI